MRARVFMLVLSVCLCFSCRSEPGADKPPAPAPAPAPEENAKEKSAPPERSSSDVLTASEAGSKQGRLQSTATPCERYLKCCFDYAEALARVPRVLPGAVDEIRSSCEQVKSLSHGGAKAQAACAQMLEGFTAAGRAYRTTRGFVWPESCGGAGEVSR